MSSKPSPFPESVRDAFLRSPTKEFYIKIKTVCKQCKAEFVGNAEAVKDWEIDHLKKCSKMD